MKSGVTISAVLLLLSGSAAAANIYKCSGPNATITYTQTPCEIKKMQQLEVFTVHESKQAPRLPPPQHSVSNAPLPLSHVNSVSSVATDTQLPSRSALRMQKKTLMCQGYDDKITVLDGKIQRATLVEEKDYLKEYRRTYSVLRLTDCRTTKAVAKVIASADVGARESSALPRHETRLASTIDFDSLSAPIR